MNDAVWHTCQPLAKPTYSGFMTDLCKQAKCSTIYTAHCLCATAIQAMGDAGYELRHIMFMTGHKNEASIRSYNRHCSVQQKKSLSATLSRVATGEVVASSARTPVQQGIAPQNCKSQNLPFASGIWFQRNEPQSNMSNVLTNAGILNNYMFQAVSSPLTCQSRHRNEPKALVSIHGKIDDQCTSKERWLTAFYHLSTSNTLCSQ